MSTIVLTPTHIASDHAVIHKCYPHETRTDIDHRKIFTNPSRRFMIATVGEFIPEEIDTEKTYDSMGFLFSYFINCQNILGSELVTFDDTIDERANKHFQHYKDVFDCSARTFIFNRTYRFMIFYSKRLNILAARRCGPYAGAGSGGMTAVGLLLGGTPLDKIWDPLHALDHQTSIEHTSIPLSSLRPMRKLAIDRIENLRKGKV